MIPPNTPKPGILSLQFYTYPDELGGAWKYTYEMNKRLAERGWPVHLITCKPENSLPDEEVIDGVQYHRISKKDSRSVFRLYRAIKKRVRLIQQTCDLSLMHIHNPLVGFLALLIRDCRKLSCVVHMHSLWFDEERINHGGTEGSTGLHPSLWARLQVIKMMEWTDFWFAKSVMFLSQYMRGNFLKFYPFKNPPLRVIPGGVDTQRFHPPEVSSAECRLRLNLPADLPILITVRRLETRMGLDRLITAAGMIRDKRPDLKFLLLIVGKGSLDSTLRKQVERERLVECVQLTGPAGVDELTDYYGSADLFVLPTAALEGFGLATVEAMACGVPPLGTPVGGTVEILKQLDERLLFANPSAEAMAERIEYFLDHPEITQALKSACREQAVRLYDWEKVVDHIEEEYQRVLKL